MADDETQPTQPKGIDPETGEPYEPAEIPVPTREAVFGDLRKAAPPAEPSAEDDRDGPRKGVA